jgi:hypothetical protein
MCSVGGFLVGKHHVQANAIAQSAGLSCSIKCLPRAVSATISSIWGDCLVIEAASEGELARAEHGIYDRIEDVFFTPSTNTAPRPKPPPPPTVGSVYAKFMITLP